MNRLYTTDLKAINHVLMNNYTYQKPGAARFGLSQILGDGVLVTEEDKHKQQVRDNASGYDIEVLKCRLNTAKDNGRCFLLQSCADLNFCQNPAFGAAQIRELTGIFFEKSIEVRDRALAVLVQDDTDVARLQLRDAWMSQLQGTDVETINVLSWLSRTTLDVIGLAGKDAFDREGEVPRLIDFTRIQLQVQRTRARCGCERVDEGVQQSLREQYFVLSCALLARLYPLAPLDCQSSFPLRAISC